MNEQEKYFDRKIAGRLENAGVDAPFSWEEMDRLLNQRNRRWMIWLRGFFFSDLLIAGLLVFGAMNGVPDHHTAPAAAEVVTMTEHASTTTMSGASPIQSSPTVEDEGAEKTADETTVDRAAIVPSSSSGRGSRSMANANRNAVESEALSVVKKNAENIPVAESALKSMKTVKSRAKAASTHINKTENTVTSHANTSSFVERTTADNSKNLIADAGINPLSSAAEKSPVTITQEDDRFITPLQKLPPAQLPHQRYEDVSVPTGKKGAKMQEDELGPALISVYGTGFLEKVNYQSLLSADEQLDFQRKLHAGSGFGMMLGYQMNPRYSLHIGLEFTRREIAFDWTTTGVQTNMMVDSQWVQIITPDTSYFTLDFDTTYFSQAVREKLGYTASVSVMTVPIVLHYTIPAGSWIWSPYAGLEYNSRTATRLIRKYNPEENISVNESNLKETWNYFSLRGGIKLARRLNANVDVFSGFDFRYNIPVNRQNLKGGAFNLQLGLVLHR